jgi:hypothetical protein
MRTMLRLLVLTLVLAPVSLFGQEQSQGRHRDELKGVGPYRVDMWYTENAFVTRKVRPEFLYLAEKGGGSQWTLPIEAEYAFMRDLSMTATVPVNGWSTEGASEAGLGDITVGAKYAFLNDDSKVFSGVLAIDLPTGDENKGLGEGHASLEVAPRLWLPFGPDERFEFQLAAPIEISFKSDEDVGGEIDAALAWTFPHGLTLLVEGITDFSFDGGDPNWYVAPGLQWQLTKGYMVGASIRLPLDGPEADEQDFTLAFGLLKEWEMPWGE